MGHRDATRALSPTGLRGEHRAPTLVFRADVGTEEVGASRPRFGPYMVFEQLGRGGMATVHRAERSDGFRQRVALKRLLPHVGRDPELVQQFLHEAELVHGLCHRNIASVYDSGCIGGEYFLAMEHVAGPSLKQLLQTSAETVGLIPFPLVVSLLAQLCDALAHAHEHTDRNGKLLGLVHRDVSPSNIVISTNGVVKLIDFGIAKTVSTNTQIGTVKGKFGYIAPEYLEGTLDRRADLWAVGVVAWELLTNRRLFTADDDLSMMRDVLEKPIEPPSVHNPDVPPELDAIVMTALARDPSKRWQNAAAMRTALLGVTRPSSNSELVEWVEWVMKLAERGLRPARGSRPLAAQKAMMLRVPVPGMVAVPELPMAARVVLPLPAPPPSAPPVPAPLPATPVIRRRAERSDSFATLVARPPRASRTGLWALLLCVAWGVAAAVITQVL